MVKRDVCIAWGGRGIPPSERPRHERPRHERLSDWKEVVRCYSLEETTVAAQRCLAAHICTFCEVCQLLCPDQCITRDPETGGIQIDLNYCKGCGLCAQFCPKGAIQMEPEPPQLHP